MCSRTRRVSGTLPTWSIAPVRMRFWGLVGSPPNTRVLPELGCMSPSNSFTAVVLPAPLGPSSATTWPARTVKFTLRRARISP